MGATGTAWGRWGADDERGALNLVTPQRVLSALGAARTGTIHSLGLPVQRSGVPVYDFRGAPYRLTLYNEQDAVAGGNTTGPGANADLLVAALHNGTHMDALCHVFAEGQIYNGFPAASFTPARGAAHCGIEKVEGLVAKGVMLDIAAALDVECLEPGAEVTGSMIERAEERQGVALGAGDVALLHTGWMRWFLEEAAQGRPPSLDRQPGLGRSGANLLVERDIAAIGADNLAVEALSPELPLMDLHVELIVRRGIPFVEGLDLRGPVGAGASEGTFVVAPLRITGGSGSPVNPLLIT